MKVLMFGWEFPPHITGGLGTACYGLCRGLLAQGMQVIFTVPKLYGDEDGKVARMLNASDIEIDLRHKIYRNHWENLTYIEVGANLVPYMGFDEYIHIENNIKEGQSYTDSWSKRKYSFSGKYQANLMDEVHRYSLVAATVAMQHEYDLIHAHDWLTYPAGIAAKKASGKPLVIHVHATEFDRTGKNVNPIVYNIEKEGMMLADKIITVSNLTRQTVIERYGIDPSKVATVYNAVEPIQKEEQLSAPAKERKEKIVTFLGRVTYQKGPEYFVEAAHRVLQKDPNIKFVMAGDGDMLHKIVHRVAQLRMGSKFFFTGFLKGLDVDKMFGLSDVYVMPSVSEPFGISPLEAMRSNVPVVISKQSGVSEILNYALKVDYWDIDAMADAIYGLCHYEALSKVFKKYGASEVNNLKWEDSAKKVHEVYKSALMTEM